nr:molybdenum cofactor biosynthesis protein MoaE [Dissulfurirhabdus thermomarina]
MRRLKDRPDLHRAGMVLVHNGVVRGTSRDGTPVSAVEIRVDRARLAEILAETRALPGIVAAEAEIREGTLRVGEDVMLLGVAGDVRERVIAALARALDRIKAEVTRKREIPAGE